MSEEETWTVVTGKKVKSNVSNNGQNPKATSGEREREDRSRAPVNANANNSFKKNQNQQKYNNNNNRLSGGRYNRDDNPERWRNTKGPYPHQSSSEGVGPGGNGSKRKVPLGNGIDDSKPGNQKEGSKASKESLKGNPSSSSRMGTSPSASFNISFKQTQRYPNFERRGNSGTGSTPGSSNVPPARPSSSKESFQNSKMLPVAVSTTKKDPMNNVVLPISTSGLCPDHAPVQARPKRKKKATQEERRRRREEKFYQGLNRTDSHVRFVSADVIKLMQSQLKDTPKCSGSPKLSAPVPDPPLSSTATVKEIPTKKWPRGNICTGNLETDFPSLTPSPTGSAGPSTSQKASTNAVFQLMPIKEEVCPPAPVTSHVVSKSVEVKFPGIIVASPDPAPTTSTTPKGKKSKQPLVIDVTSLIVSKKKDPEKRTIPSGIGKMVSNRKENHKLTAGNPLDSSGPGVIHRGKIRLTQKKKPTKLKLTIMKSRVLTKILKEEQSKQKQEEGNEDNTDIEKDVCSTAGTKVGIDAVSEVKEEIKSDLEEPEVKTEMVVKQDPQTPSKVDDEEAQPHLGADSSSDPDSSHKLVKLFTEITSNEIAMMNMESQIPDEVKATAKQSMHHKRFREYCDMLTSKELHKLVTNLLRDLHKFQDRLYHSDPIKFKTKRRYVLGLKEALSFVNLNKVQLLIIAPDIEKNPEPGGLDDKIREILVAAKDRNVPYVFTGTKYNLGKPIRCKQPISIISVLDKQNCEETFRALLDEAALLREKYEAEFLLKVKAIMDKEKTNDCDGS